MGGVQWVHMVVRVQWVGYSGYTQWLGYSGYATARGMMQGPGYNQMGPQGGKPGYPGMQGGESYRVQRVHH